MTRTFAKAAWIATLIAALALGAMVGAGGVNPEMALTDALITVGPILAATLAIQAAVLLPRSRRIVYTATDRRALADLDLRAEALDH